MNRIDALETKPSPINTKVVVASPIDQVVHATAHQLLALLHANALHLLDRIATALDHLPDAQTMELGIRTARHDREAGHRRDEMSILRVAGRLHRRDIET